MREYVTASAPIKQPWVRFAPYAGLALYVRLVRFVLLCIFTGLAPHPALFRAYCRTSRLARFRKAFPRHLISYSAPTLSNLATSSPRRIVELSTNLSPFSSQESLR